LLIQKSPKEFFWDISNCISLLEIIQTENRWLQVRKSIFNIGILSVVELVETTIGLFPIAGVSMLRQAQQPQAQRPQ